MRINSMRIECAFVQSTSGGGLKVDSKRIAIEVRGQGRKSCDTVPYHTAPNTTRRPEESRRTANCWQDVWRVDSRGSSSSRESSSSTQFVNPVRQCVIITCPKIASPLIRMESLLSNCSCECAQCALNSHCHECEFNASSMRIDSRYHVNGP